MKPRPASRKRSPRKVQLNAEQLRVVECDGHCLVVACPGSGKTRVITTKIGALLKRHPRSRIVAVTFTRESAAELTHRVTEEIGKPLFNAACRIGTFHSLCIRQLRNHNRIGKVAGPGEQVMFVKRAISMASPGMAWEEATGIIERAKGSLGGNEAQETDLYRAYAGLLSKHNVCDLYDVIRDSVRMMRTGEIRPYPAKFLLIDEFQDTDDIQLQWALEHAKAGTNVTVVGDDDQSIYGWRGALGYGGMQRFIEATKGEHITLGLNYRCRAEILGAADIVIRHNAARIDKALVAARGPGGGVHISRHANREFEAEACVARIDAESIPLPDGTHPLFTKSVREGSWAVLCRNRRHLDRIEKHLQRAGIQLYRPPKESFWSRAPQSILLSLLASIDSKTTSGFDAAIEHALSMSVKGSAARLALQHLHEQVHDFGVFRYGAVTIDYDKFMPEEAKVIADFASRVPAWARNIDAGRYNMVIRAVSDWFASFEDSEESSDDLRSAGETICKLRGTLTMRVNALTSTANSGKGKPQGVQLHTMHGSKGLEFDSVWIVATESSTIPSPKASDYEEERRLMYVAMTRAKNWLMLSSITTEKVSPFVEETGLQPDVDGLGHLAA